MHKDFIDHICYITKPFHAIVTGGRDGQVLLWRPSDLTLIKKIAHEGIRIIVIIMCIY